MLSHTAVSVTWRGPFTLNNTPHGFPPRVSVRSDNGNCDDSSWPISQSVWCTRLRKGSPASVGVEFDIVENIVAPLGVVVGHTSSWDRMCQARGTRVDGYSCMYRQHELFCSSAVSVFSPVSKNSCWQMVSLTDCPVRSLTDCGGSVYNKEIHRDLSN